MDEILNTTSLSLAPVLHVTISSLCDINYAAYTVNMLLNEIQEITDTVCQIHEEFF